MLTPMARAIRHNSLDFVGKTALSVDAVRAIKRLAFRHAGWARHPVGGWGKPAPYLCLGLPWV